MFNMFVVMVALAFYKSFLFIDSERQCLHGCRIDNV